MNCRELSELIKSRRSIRKFDSKSIPKETLFKVIEAGIWAPTGSNQQEIRFLIIKSPHLLREFLRFKKIGMPAVVVLLLIDWENYYKEWQGGKLKYHPHKKYLPYIDTGLAMMNMMLMAECLGVKSVPLNVSKHLFYIKDKNNTVFRRFLRKIAIKLCISRFGVRFFYDFCEKELKINTTRYIPSGAIAFGYSNVNLNIGKLKHAGKPVCRKNVNEYIVDVI